MQEQGKVPMSHTPLSESTQNRNRKTLAAAQTCSQSGVGPGILKGDGDEMA